MTSVIKMLKALQLIQEAADKRDIPVNWIELLLRVADAGERGITAKELEPKIGVVQGIISRAVKNLSTYYDEKKGSTVGAELLFVTPDPVHRHRHAIILTAKGKALIEEINKVLS